MARFPWKLEQSLQREKVLMAGKRLPWRLSTIAGQRIKFARYAGGGRSLQRTRLKVRFPCNREKYREYSLIEGT